MTVIRPELHRAPTPKGLTGAAVARRSSTIAAAVAAVLGAAFAPHALAQQASAEQLQTLKDQINRLQQQVEHLQEQQTQQAQTQPAVPAPAAAAPAASKSASPAFKAGPVTVTLGGYMALEGLYRDKNQTADIGSNYNGSIPYAYQTNDHIDETRFSARQSRFSLLAQGPVYGGISGEGYLETDFLSAGVSSNSAESNSYTLRMRNFYGVLRDADAGWYFLGGQNWSLATLYGNAQLTPRGERVPQTIDAQYVAGFNWTRNAQVRFVKSWDKMASFGISVESPQASIYTGCSGAATPAPAGCGSVSALVTNTGGSLLNSTTNYSIDFAPDIIAKFALDPGYGHYEVYGLARGFRDRSPNTAAGTNNTSWGGSIGAGMILPLGPMLEFQLSGLGGSGNGRYGSAQLPDATLKSDGRVVAIKEYQVMAGFVLKPDPAWMFYLYGGKEQASRTAYNVGANGYGYGNSAYNNSGCSLLTGSAATCIANTRSVEMLTGGSWWKVYQGDIGNFQIGLEYSWLEREAFSGVGGDPSANIGMGFVSFRWYPYQK
jgi:type II secretory pathway pseudopilin PulG